MNGDMVDSVSAYNLTNQTYWRTPLNYDDACLNHSYDAGRPQFGTAAAGLQIHGAMTFAALIYIVDEPSTAVPIARYSHLTGALTETNNDTWIFSLNATNNLIYAHEYGNKTYTQDVSIITVPKEEWVHVALTRDATGAAGYFCVSSQSLGDVSEAWSVAAIGTGGSGGRFSIAEKFDGSFIRANYSSMIFKNVDAGTAGAFALARDVGL